MNALDRCLFSLALLLAVSGSVALYAQGQKSERQADTCRTMRLQVAASGAF